MNGLRFVASGCNVDDARIERIQRGEGNSTLGNQDEINVSETWHLEIAKQTRATRMTAVEPADDKSKVLGRVT